MKQRRDGGSAGGELVELDDLLQHRARITVAVLLSRHDQLSFSRLKELLDETDGNLGAHLRRLEDAGYLTVRKEFQDRRPVTWYRLTPKGRRALTSHLEGLGRLIKHAGGTGGAGR
ncbi:MAG: winged helix-turn-helix domain-containing protein [Vicinamibacterales bacterium]